MTTSSAARRPFGHRGQTVMIGGLVLEGLMALQVARQPPDFRAERRGDFVDLHSFTLKQGSITTSCDVTPCASPRRRSCAIHREWMLSLGRRTAVARTAHLFCELFIRFELVGMTEGGSYRLPITQTDLAECLGLTAVHVNRTLKVLREQGLVAFRGGTVTIHDMAGLKRVAEFSPAYLSLEKRPR